MAKCELTTAEIEQRLALFFDYRRQLIVPRVSWGFGIHECDLVVVSEAGYMTEVEIKISAADLRKDSSKIHGHVDPRHRIKKLYFAVPESLVHLARTHAPARAGIITISEDTQKITIERKPVDDREACKLTESEQAKLARLGALRIWSLQQKVTRLSETVESFRDEVPHRFAPKRVTDKVLKSASVKSLEAWREMYAWHREPRQRIEDEIRRREDVITYQI